MSEAKGPYTAREIQDGIYVIDGPSKIKQDFVEKQVRYMCNLLNAAHAAGVEEGVAKAIHDLWEAVHDQPEEIRARYVAIGNKLKATTMT